MTKCSVNLSCNSKLLLKVLTCLWNQYIKGHTQYTQIYQAAPSEEAYLLMETELNARFSTIQSSHILEKLNICTTQNPTYVELIVGSAYGNVVYYNSGDAPVVFDVSGNTFENASTASIVPFNIGTHKPVQKLNIDECLENSYQINPEYLYNADSQNYYSATAATIVGRTGCSGVANTGFISLSIFVDNLCFPVSSCVKESCCA